MKKTILALVLAAVLATPAFARPPHHGGFGPRPCPVPVMHHSHHHHGGGFVPFIVGATFGAIATAVATPPPPPPPPHPVVYTAPAPVVVAAPVVPAPVPTPAPVVVVTTPSPSITRTERVTSTTIVNGVQFQTIKTRIYWSDGSITEN